MSQFLDQLTVPIISGPTNFTVAPSINGTLLSSVVVAAPASPPTIGATKPNVASVTVTDCKTFTNGTNVTVDCQLEVTSTATNTPSYFTMSLPGRTANFNDYRVGTVQAVGVPTVANLSAGQTAGFTVPKDILNLKAVAFPGTAVAQISYTSPADITSNTGAQIQKFRVVFNYTTA